MILLSAGVDSNEIPVLRRQGAIVNKTNVISLVFCESILPPEEKMSKNILDEVHTFAKLKHDPRASLPDAFTVCSTIMTAGCPSYSWPSFFNMLDNNGDQFMVPSLSRGNVESGFVIGFNQRGVQQLTDRVPPLFPNQWIRSCIAVNTTSGVIHWVVEGALVMARQFVEMKNPKTRPRDLSRKLVLGARLYGGSWFASSQKVTDLDIYSSPLSIERMESMTRDESCADEGDYLAWREMEWIVHGQARKEVTEREETCEEKPLVDFFFAPFPGMDSCMHHCKNLGTRVPSVATLEAWTKLQSFLKKKLFDRGLNTLDLWLPIEDRDTEDVWKDFYTGQVVQNFTQPWFGSKADGGRAENCARLLNGHYWADRDCDYPNYGCICSHKPDTNLKLRGLCPSTAIDNHYKSMNKRTDNREQELQGATRTKIKYVKEQNRWSLDVMDSNVTGTSTASFASFTLGKHNWTIKGDKGCSSGDTYVTELKMSGCQEGDFTCNDGQCVRMDQRCNQLPDCRDESDEKNCNILLVQDGYNKKIPPYFQDDPVNVSVSIELLRLVAINEEDYSIEIQFGISLMWKEHRVIFDNLKLSDSMNALTEEDIEKLWLPKVIYENTDQKETTRLGEFGNGEWETEVIVRREVTNGTSSGLEYVDEREIFKGSENSLIMSQTYTRTFHCNFQLSHYPFDTQVSKSFFHQFQKLLSDLLD